MSDDAVIAVIDALERLNVPCMAVGSLSCNLYDIPRSTQDADFVVKLDAARGLSRCSRRSARAFRSSRKRPSRR